MRFKVLGADPETGHDLSIELEAPTLAEARQRGYAMGMLISRVEPIGDGPSPPTTPGPESRSLAVPSSVPTVIEQTSKRWKLLQIVGVLLIIIGATMMMLAYMTGNDRYPDQGVLMGRIGAMLALLVGPIAWIAGRIGAWWYHG